jgi:3',5'-cyclic AMP phosphodiesterase CpdA
MARRVSLTPPTPPTPPARAALRLVFAIALGAGSCRVLPGSALASPGLVAAAAAAVTGTGPGAGPTRMVKGPYLTGLSPTGIDVRFELDVDGPAAVEVVKEGAPPGQATHTFTDHGALPGERTLHEVHVTGLDPGARYAYLVRAGGAVLGNGHLTTAPDPAALAGAGPGPGAGAPLHFIVYGDNRSDPSAHAAVVRALAQTPFDFLVNTGDIVEDGGSAQDWQTFFEVEEPILRDHALLLCIGNHELYDDAAGANFARYFGFSSSGVGAGGDAPGPYGTMRFGNARFFFLNAMDDFGSGPERAWLERALASADSESGLTWRIAVVHHGPWSSGPHGPNKRLVEARIPELLALHKVDLVLSGHDHIYERGDSGSMKYVISGGGGAPLYRVPEPIGFSRRAEPTYHFVDFTVTRDAVRLVATRVDGSILDKCGFAKDGPWDCDPPPAGAPATGAALRAGGAVGSPGDGGGRPSGKSSCGCSAVGSPATTSLALGGGGLAALGAIVAMAAIALRRRRG